MSSFYRLLKSSKIPIVSLEKLTRPTSTTFTGKRAVVSQNDWLTTAESFDKALSCMGFVYIADHGVPEKKIKRLFEESVPFFQLPFEKKMAYQRDFQTTFHGYTQVGGELMTKDVSIELREMFDAAVADTEEFAGCPYPDKEVPGLKPAMKDFMLECRNVSKTLLKLLALGLNLDNAEYFLNCHKNIDDPSTPSYSQLRSLFYPCIPKNVQPGAIRCAQHTDYGTLSLLFQDSVGGLEIKSAQDGTWIPANPIPGCILVNVGDLLHMWTGGQYPSTVHRVVIPAEEINRATPRQSIGLFLKPDNNTLVAPLKKEFETESRLEKVLAGEHFINRTVHHRQLAASY